ncbi:MAG TPA: IS110 family transposase [Rhodanobacter sp.]|nr:IS110 family transposase [Rhodanobacter sp.]
MTQSNDLSRSLVVLEQDTTLIAVVELSQSTWLTSALVPGLSRDPVKKLEGPRQGRGKKRRAPVAEDLLAQLQRWRDEALKAGRRITRVAVAFEAGRDGFWLARCLQRQGVEAYVIHPSSVPVPRQHRRAKSDRLDLQLLMRCFLGWLRGEKKHCQMCAIPTLEEEDARRPGRERETLVVEVRRTVNRMKSRLAQFGVQGFKPTLRRAAAKLAALRTPEGEPLPANTRAELERLMQRLLLLRAQIKEIEAARLERLEQAPEQHAPVLQLARAEGLGVETADLLVREVFSRPLRDERAVGRYGGLTGAPDQSGARCREQGLARSGNARVKRSMIQLAWRFLQFQPDLALVRWYRERTAKAARGVRKQMIVALARKLLVALWRMAGTGEVPEGLRLRPATIAV